MSPTSTFQIFVPTRYLQLPRNWNCCWSARKFEKTQQFWHDCRSLLDVKKIFIFWKNENNLNYLWKRSSWWILVSSVPFIPSRGSADVETHFLSFATVNAFSTVLSCPLSSSLPVASTKWIHELAKRPLGETENCRKGSEFFRRKCKEFLTNHETHSEGNVQHVWTEALSVTLKTTKKSAASKVWGFFFSMLFSASVFPEASPAKHVGGSRTKKLQGGLSFLQLQFIRSDSPLYTCVSLRSQSRSIRGESS